MPQNPNVPIGTDIYRAIACLCEREVILIPTENEYVLACHALDEQAVGKLVSFQAETAGSPLEVLVPSLPKLREHVREFPDALESLACRFPPGRLTFLLPKRFAIPERLSVGDGKIAISVAHHSLTLAVLEKLHFPLAVLRFSSFKTLGGGSADYLDLLGDRIGYVLDGGSTVVGPGSTWVEMGEGSILVYRTGAVSREEIEDGCGLPTFVHLSPMTREKAIPRKSVTRPS